MLNEYEDWEAKMAAVGEEPEVVPKSRVADHTQRAPSRTSKGMVSTVHAVSAT